MRYWQIINLFVIVLMIGLQPSLAADFHVSTVGSDDWSGTLDKPNAKESDGPFATIERARDAVRALKESGADQDIVVQIRGGEYRLSKTVVFGRADSGEGDSTITYEAFPGETPIFHSDAELNGWKKLKAPLPDIPAAAHGKVWVTDVPKWKGTGRRFLTLYDKTGRLPRARSDGFIPVMHPAGWRKSKSTKEILHFPAGQIRNWSNMEDVELVVRPTHAWVVNFLQLQSVNEQTQMARTKLPATYTMNGLHFLKETKCVWIENTIEALDSPGEWVLNTQEAKLYLWPREDGPPKNITAPRLKEYFRVEGELDVQGPTDLPARNLVFRGLTFTRGDSDRMTEDDKGLQHDWEMHDKGNALLRLRGAEHCTIEQCHFVESGGAAIRVDLLGRHNQILNNHIEHIGATGVLLCGYGPGTKDVNHHNLIASNHIHHVGEIHAHAPGIFIWQSGENRVVNNLIHHTPYSGIILSGVMTHFFSKYGNGRELTRTIRWKEVGAKRKKYALEDVRPFLHSHDNLIEYNEIHHAMEQLGDGNGIYIRGAGAGNIIRRNYIHHLVSPIVLQSAIRTDGGQRDTLISENLIYRCTSSGIHLKLNNHVVNNVIADLIPGIHNGESRPPSYFKLREGPLTGAVIKRNILFHTGDKAVFFDQGRNPRLPDAWAHQADTDHNVYFCAGDPQVSQTTLNKTKRAGVDQHSKATNPLFVNPSKGDFRLQPDSPALKLGIVPIDREGIGREPRPSPEK